MLKCVVETVATHSDVAVARTDVGPTHGGFFVRQKHFQIKQNLELMFLLLRVLLLAAFAQ